ncbi:MAG: hypothetical protein QXZ70_01160 [Candidatus Bathyarchaeia archaeon]
MVASVRTINVSGRSYLQVVEYVNVDGKRSVKILRSFGPNNLQNRLQAEQFASNYNSLRLIVQKEAQQPNVNIENLLKGALVIFGIILGAKIISDIIHELSKPDD